MEIVESRSGALANRPWRSDRKRHPAGGQGGDPPHDASCRLQSSLRIVARSLSPTLLRPINSYRSDSCLRYGAPGSGHRPLVILNSIDFPMPPSEAFCERMWQAGFRTVFVERPGFGTSTPLPYVLLNAAAIQQGATSMTEAVILQDVFQTKGIESRPAA